MVEIFSTEFNFSIAYQPDFNDGGLVFGTHMIQENTLKSLILSDPIFVASDVLVVPPGESYTS